MYAKATIIGNVTADPIVKTVTVKGESRDVTTFSVAVNDRFNKEKEASFFNDISAWNGLGKNVAQYVRKGSKVAVVAKVEQTKWEKDGHKHSSYRFVAEDVVFLSSAQSREDAIPDEVLAQDAPPATEPTTEPTTEPVAEQPVEATSPAEDQMEVPF